MKPIGYLLNRTDKALTGYMNHMLEEFGLTRTAWQVLNLVHDTPGIADKEVLTNLAANAGSAVLNGTIDTVLADDWAYRPAPGRLALTPDGSRRLTDVAARVDAFRELSTTGISLDEYRTTVRVLERISRNLETATSTSC
ncbi:MarR family winged helix-turn-helix transcriptional regulator [Streptomyces sp. NPDC029080]|uniref:MarR family winged helix-turn-helix transcriptional regulator n=1 Tax=Streptomyces sp. NPDC029080 TaxID=3155017 RepID=UPI0033CBBD6F